MGGCKEREFFAANPVKSGGVNGKLCSNSVEFDVIGNLFQHPIPSYAMELGMNSNLGRHDNTVLFFIQKNIIFFF